MTTLTPYLLFDGNCRQAMVFYRSCLGGELSLTVVKDTSAKEQMPASQHDKVLNARLRGSNLDVSASDWLRPDRTPVHGNTACLYLSGGPSQELRSLFEKLSEGGEVTDPLSQQFFGTYGALNDQFGVRWMFHTQSK
jgi:PhnB protein